MRNNQALPTERGLIKLIVFGILTLGIYPIVVTCLMSEEINIVATQHDGKRTMHFLLACLLGMLTFGIYFFVWFHKFSNRIGDELIYRNIEYDFDSNDFWLWCVLGSFIYVGPYIYQYKLLKAMNLINEAYNNEEGAL